MVGEESITLYCKQGTSDKVYKLHLIGAGMGRYHVKFEFGRRGSELKSGLKSSKALSYKDAKILFDKVVREKMSHGYVEDEPQEDQVAASQPVLTVQAYALRCVTKKGTFWWHKVLNQWSTRFHPDASVWSHDFNGGKALTSGPVDSAYPDPVEVVPVTMQVGPSKRDNTVQLMRRSSTESVIKRVNEALDEHHFWVIQCKFGKKTLYWGMGKFGALQRANFYAREKSATANSHNALMYLRTWHAGHHGPLFIVPVTMRIGPTPAQASMVALMKRSTKEVSEAASDKIPKGMAFRAVTTAEVGLVYPPRMARTIKNYVHDSGEQSWWLPIVREAYQYFEVPHLMQTDIGDYTWNGEVDEDYKPWRVVIEGLFWNGGADASESYNFDSMAEAVQWARDQIGQDGWVRATKNMQLDYDIR